MMSNYEMLLDLNVIDYSILKELCLYLNINNDKQMLQTMINELNSVFKDKLDKFGKDLNTANFTILYSYSIFFMIVLLNLKSRKHFISLVFEKDSQLMNTLIKVIKKSSTFKNSSKISKIFCNLFLDEYKDLYFSHDDPDLEEMFIVYNEKFSQINVEGIDVYPKQIYHGILNNISNLTLSYEFLFKNLFSSCKKNFFEESDKPTVKLQLIQSIIRVVFSKEKFIYLKEDSNYEYEFLNHVVDKSILDTKEKYGDNFSCLFRKEEISDEIIKYFFYIFGNSLLIKSFITPLKSTLPLFEKTNTLNKEGFISFFENAITNISSTMPNILKILVKLVHIKVKENFTIEKDNYSPILTLLFFNFFISPRVQEIYKISPVKYTMIKHINRIIRNICYNTKFDEKDELSEYNDIIEGHNSQLKGVMEEILTAYKDDNELMLKCLKEYTNDNNFILPKFLFYADCSYVAFIMKNGMKEKFDIYEVIKRESAPVKFN